MRGEHLIVLELRLQLLQRGLETRNVLQFFLRELLQHLQARTLVALGKHDVETDDRNLVVIEQFVEQQGEPVARAPTMIRDRMSRPKSSVPSR